MMTDASSPTTETASERALRLLTRASIPRRARRFSTFDPDDANEAVQLARRIHDATRVTGVLLGGPRALRAAEADRLKAVLGELEREGHDDDLLKYALSIFAVNTEVGRRHVRKPLVWKVFPDRFRHGAPVHAEAPRLQGVARRPTPAQQERRLAWFREDPLLNEHHFHWHVVFPQTGDPNAPRKGEYAPPKDRQGELFYYMHRQMLARYNAERLCLGLGHVEPYSDLTQPIALGYSSGLDQFIDRPDGRPPGASFTSSRTRKTVTQAMANGWGDLLLQAAQTGRFALLDDLPVTPKALGGALEANADAPDYTFLDYPQAGKYGNLHNMGHMLIASAVDDPESLGRMGVLSDTATALRDPIFWRWHQHIDDLYDAWLRWRGPQPFDKAEAPPVTFPRTPLVLAFRDAIPGAADDPGFDYAAWGAKNLHRSWLEPHTTSRLETTMLRRTLHTYEWTNANAGMTGEDGQPLAEAWVRQARGFEVEYLDHREFVLFHRVNATAACTVSLRVFMALEDLVDDNRQWIELDRQVVRLQPGLNVVARPAWQFSVVRKPCGKPPLDFDTEHMGGAGQDPPDSESANFCDCGWPYNLLLPRGTGRGVKARLFVMATDYAKDDATGGGTLDECCGSLSFCGSKSPLYPDAREMGFPFHAPFPKGGFAAAFKGLPNVAWRTFTLKWTNPDASAAPAPKPRRKAARPAKKAAKKGAKKKAARTRPRAR